MNEKHKISFVMTCAFWGLLLIVGTAISGFAQTCGNGQIDPGEQCDSGSQSGGCCTAECQFATADSSCNDGDPNTIDSCNPVGVCVGRAQTTTCGACRNPNDAQDRSFCDPVTNQCVRQVEDCAPFFIEADGSENKCQSNYGRDPNTGQCFYRKKMCTEDGCFRSACDPTDGVCKTTDADDPRNVDCEGSDTFCQPDGTCEFTACAFESCDPQGDFRNCDEILNTNCAEENVGSCQTPRQTDPAEGIIFGCQANQGCVYQAVVCEQSANPCEELVRDQDAQGCCTYQPRNCAAEFGNNPNFTYTCDPTATNGVCQATPTPTPTAPTITGAVITRRQNDPAAVSPIATVSDAQTPAGNLTVSLVSAPTGIFVTNIVNNNGAITASVAAGCNAAIGNNSVGLKVTDSDGGMTTGTLTVNVTGETTPPVINPIANVSVTLPPNSPATSMVVNFPLPTATDNCSMPTITTNPVSGSVFNIGTTTVNVTATDSSGNTATSSFTVNVRYNFAGFFQPVDNLPVINVATAGSSIPVKFSLNGNQGLAIFAPGFPASGAIPCGSSGSTSTIEETVTAGNSTLTYDATTNQYRYVWATNRAWRGTCRQLQVRFIDGTTYVANFQFR